ncbi:hypothetical protein BWR15_20265 [Pseudomonas sp. T]|nr:hypothetical protein BWR15_20265 [Pseudomonas sp. T]
MSARFSLSEWNFQMLMLVQALVGAVSSNFRMVSLSCDDAGWILSFYLEKDLEDDVEEIEDVVCQYTAYQDSNLKCRYEVVIGDQSLPVLAESERVVYRRRE